MIFKDESNNNRGFLCLTKVGKASEAFHFSGVVYEQNLKVPIPKDIQKYETL